MNQLSEGKEIIKLAKKLNEGDEGKFRGMSVKELEFELLQTAKHREEIASTRKDDEELQSAKQIVKELNQPYSEQLKAVCDKSRFIALLMKEKAE
jgi:hypothetical protein